MRRDNESENKSSTSDKNTVATAFVNVFQELSNRGLQVADLTRESITNMLDETIALEQTAEQMSSDEIHLLSQYVVRDVRSLAYYLHEGSRGLANWLNFDLAMLEHDSVEKLLALADKTLTENLLLKEKLECNDSQYLSGEVCMFGTLRCLNCGVEQVFFEIQEIAPCSSCQSDYFERVMSK